MEGALLPRLRDAVGQEDLYALAEALVNARRLAPTRPHPHTPSRAPGNIVVRDTPMFRTR